MSQYPLPFDSREKKRLDSQVGFLFDTSLLYLLASAKSCLEVGCGIGSNLRIIRKANPNLKYTGVDFNQDAIRAAALSYAQDSLSLFEVMDANALTFPDESFDVVFSRLVFWAIPSWKKSLSEALRVTKKGGYFYSFEPDDNMLIFYPAKANIEAAVGIWQNEMLKKGMNPFVGRAICSEISTLELANINSFLFTRVWSGKDSESYKAAAENLKNIFLSPQNLLWNEVANKDIFDNAKVEFSHVNDSDVIVEGYFVNVCQK